MSLPRLALIALAALTALGLAASPVMAAPCLVTATVPAAGADAVNPALKALTVSFNQAMLPGSWSFVTNPKLGRFPKLAGRPKFTDPKTCVLPVALEPGVTYAVGLNTEGYGNFRPAASPKTPCASYQMIFTTAK